MARWNEEQDRWMGRGDRYGEDERRFRGERGEEGGWRGRDWREDERFGEGRRGGERDERERYTTPRDEYGRERGRGGAGYSAERERDRLGERWRGEGAYDEGRVGAGYGGSYRGAYGQGSGFPGSRGEHSTYGSGADVGGWRTEEHRRDSGRSMRDLRYGGERDTGWSRGSEGYGDEREMGGWGRGGERYGREGERYGREEERGALDRMGDRIREGMRKLTGRGPKGYRRPDERVRDDVSERIARSWIDAENVEVKVENGEVTLTGFVARREDKRELEDLAEDVFGVVEVHNHVRVSRGEQAGQTIGTTAGTGTTGTGTTMSAQQRTTSTPSGQTPGRH